MGEEASSAPESETGWLEAGSLAQIIHLTDPLPAKGFRGNRSTHCWYRIVCESLDSKTGSAAGQE
jgi:hypothetical protein